MLKFINHIFLLVFSTIFLTNCTNNAHKPSISQVDTIKPQVSEEFLQTLATGCITSNLVRNKVPDSAILDRKKYVIPTNAPQRLAIHVAEMPGNNKVVLANQKFPQNIYVVSSDVGLCNVFLVNTWSDNIPETLSSFFNDINWQKKENFSNEQKVSETYILRSGGMTGVYSYKKGLDPNSIGLNLFVTFGLTK